MIISDTYGYLFVATLRTASTSLHAALGPRASVDIATTAEGKHWPLRTIIARFGAARIDPLYKWAVVRDPVDFLWSLYRCHQRPEFDGMPHSTRELSFEEFYASGIHEWMRMPQSSRFVDSAGRYGLDLLISFDSLHEGFGYVKFRLGLPNLLLPVLNSATAAPHAIDSTMRQRISRDYRADYELIDRYANRERVGERCDLVLGGIS